jgi:toxin-antitoxin system PIN domain toxin
VIALDTNILVHAHRRGTGHHEPALELLRRLSEGPTPFALFWPSLYEFLRIVTHHRVFDPPSSLGDALEAIRDFLSPPVVRILSETSRHPALLDRVVRESRVTGNLIHDAHLVALALEHGVHEILTLDGDFARFRQVASRNPFPA